MFDIQLLDCTLRDGGFVNDWQFGQENIIGIFEGLTAAGVDIIEVGFLDERRPFDKDRSIMPGTDSVGKLYGKLSRKSALLVGMIDYGTCPLSQIKPRAKSMLDGIRVIFKKHLLTKALGFCAALKELGYLVFVQPVSITDYSDADIKDLASLTNQLHPYALSIVDTYGLLHQEEVLRYFDLFHHALSPDIRLGFHGHNNFQMAYANCISMVHAARTAKRPLMLDGSLYGMGKSAGNAPLELLAQYLNHSVGACYDVGALLEVIDRHITKQYPAPCWGYNVFYFLAAANACHPNYVTYLMQQGLPLSSAYVLLGNLEKSKSLIFDKAYIEELCRQHQKEVDYATLSL
ncbi:MAG: aldolase catalytic domain-containing protein [Clostridia bacterium]|nr:aldolase catalytic domain-containing protein [Clostridia bacterium]